MFFIYLTRELKCLSRNPANTKRFKNICTASAQRLRRWSNIVQVLHKCFVLAGKDARLYVIFKT